MRTVEEVRVRLADFEARAEAETKAAHGPGSRLEDHVLTLELLWSWVGALAWVLGGGVDAPTTAHPGPDGEEKNPFEVPEGDDPGRYTRPRVQGGDPEAKAIVIDERDLTDGRYRICWEGSDPLETSELKGLKSLIEKWAMGGVPDRTIALEAPRVLAEFIKRVEAVDDELTGSKPNPF